MNTIKTRRELQLVKFNDSAFQEIDLNERFIPIAEHEKEVQEAVRVSTLFANKTIKELNDKHRQALEEIKKEIGDFIVSENIRLIDMDKPLLSSSIDERDVIRPEWLANKIMKKYLEGDKNGEY